MPQRDWTELASDGETQEVIGREQTESSGNGIELRSNCSNRGGCQKLRRKAAVFATRGFPRVSKLLHRLADFFNTQSEGDPAQGFHHDGVSVCVLVSVYMRGFNSRKADLFDLSAQLP